MTRAGRYRGFVDVGDAADCSVAHDMTPCRRLTAGSSATTRAPGRPGISSTFTTAYSVIEPRRADALVAEDARPVEAGSASLRSAFSQFFARARPTVHWTPRAVLAVRADVAMPTAMPDPLVSRLETAEAGWWGS